MNKIRAVIMSKLCISSYIFLVFYLSSLMTFGQDGARFQIWTDLNPSFKLNEKWAIAGDLGYRIEPESNLQIGIIRPGVNYHPNHFILLRAGMASFSSWIPNEINSHEFRPFVFGTVSWPRFNFLIVKNRLGFEQRWFDVRDLDLRTSDQRIRYSLALESADFKVFSINSPFFVEAQIEYLKAFSNNDTELFFDQNRLILILGNRITNQLKVDLRFMIIRNVNPTLNFWEREIDVIRFRFYYRFNSS